MIARRKKKRGKVIIQTVTPKHEIIAQVVKNDYTEFFNHQLEERSQFKYPPYFRLISLIVKHKQKEVAHKGAIKLTAELRNQFEKLVLGPEPPLIGRIKNWYLENILIKIPKNQNLADCKRIVLAKVQEIKLNPGYSSLQINIDVDPY